MTPFDVFLTLLRFHLTSLCYLDCHILKVKVISIKQYFLNLYYISRCNIQGKNNKMEYLKEIKCLKETLNTKVIEFKKIYLLILLVLPWVTFLRSG